LIHDFDSLPAFACQKKRRNFITRTPKNPGGKSVEISQDVLGKKMADVQPVTVGVSQGFFGDQHLVGPILRGALTQP